MANTFKNDFQQQINSIADQINDGMDYEYCPDSGSSDFENDCCEHFKDNTQSGFDYISDALDIQFIVDGNKEYLAARILVAFGGPNIWINTQTKTVEGYWWQDTAFSSYYDDSMDIDGACRELWECK